MAPNQLPARANLEQLRKRARDLLRAVRTQDPAAIAHVQRHRAGPEPRFQLADALLVIPREHGFSSWAKLKAYVESRAKDRTVAVWGSPPEGEAVTTARRPPRRGPRRMPSRTAIRDLHAGVVEAARRGAPFPFLFAPPLGPLRRAVQAPLREALLNSGDLTLVVNVLLRGAEHPHPQIRAECAHALDWLADERCLAALLRLADDPVPRVRWFAVHSLACDDCKLRPLPTCAELVPLLMAKATSDPSERVRRQAHASLRLLGVDTRAV